MNRILISLIIMLAVTTGALSVYVREMQNDMRSREIVISKLTEEFKDLEIKESHCQGVVETLTEQNQNLMNQNGQIINESKEQIEKIKTSIIDKKGIHVTATMYTPNEKECDSSPMVTASGARSTPGTTLAVSRDLSHLKGWAVYVLGEVNGKKINEVMVVQDVMNERYSKRIDIMTTNVKFANNFGVRKLTIVPIKPIG